MTERTILLDLLRTNQKWDRLIEAALTDTELRSEDYALYALIGTAGPVTPTELARELGLPLSTLLLRVRRFEERGHAERIANPDDGRSYLVELAPAGERLLRFARPLFRARVLAVEARLGDARVRALREALTVLGDAIERELQEATRASPTARAPRRRSR